MLDPDSLAAFIAIHDEGGFLAAANRLAVAQSVVSKRLLRLEDQLGVRLFDRDRRRRVVLTHEGEELLPAARATLVQLSAFERQGRNIGNGQAGELRISYVFSAIMTGVLPRLLRTLAAARPGIRLLPVPLETPEQLAEIARGSVDVAIVRPRAAYPHGADACVVHREGVLVALPVGHQLAAASVLTCADLVDTTFIVPQFADETGHGGIPRQIARLTGRSVPAIIATPDFISAAGLVAAGMGVAVVPRSLQALSLPDMVFRPIADLDAELELVALTRTSLPPRLRHELNKILRA